MADGDLKGENTRVCIIPTGTALKMPISDIRNSKWFKYFMNDIYVTGYLSKL